VSFWGKILAKFCFANFDRNPKGKGKGKETKTKQRSSRERVCLLLLVDAFFFFFFWVESFSARKKLGTTPFLLFHKISCTKLPSLIDS
jgi:hypothetical protein